MRDAILDRAVTGWRASARHPHFTGLIMKNKWLSITMGIATRPRRHGRRNPGNDQ